MDPTDTGGHHETADPCSGVTHAGIPWRMHYESCTAQTTVSPLPGMGAISAGLVTQSITINIAGVAEARLKVRSWTGTGHDAVVIDDRGFRPARAAHV